MGMRFNDRVRIACGVMGAALLLTACDPPGKPSLAEEAAESGAPVYDFGALYNENCAGCHGVNGKNGPGRILNDALYLSFTSKDALKEVLENGRPGTAMPAWSTKAGGPLNERQIDALVDGMYKNWAKPVSASGPKLPQYAQPENEAGDPLNGKHLFVRDCYMCHGSGARIGPVTDPAYLSLVSNQMLRTSIVVGRSDLGMPDYRFLNMGKPLSDKDVTDLVAYLVSRRPIEATPRESGGVETTSGSKGNEGSGNGPGSHRHREQEGIKGKGSNSQQGVK